MSVDPTAIPIELDPLRSRMRATAGHGNTPFDVAYMDQVDDNGMLWVGGCADGLVLPEDIMHVVSVYPWEQYTAHHQLRSQLSIIMYDSVGQGMGQVVALARWAHACSQDAPTLVHCQAGLNRSPLVVATLLVLRGWAPHEAILHLRRLRSPAVLCNPAFERWLLNEAQATIACSTADSALQSGICTSSDV